MTTQPNPTAPLEQRIAAAADTIRAIVLELAPGERLDVMRNADDDLVVLSMTRVTVHVATDELVTNPEPEPDPAPDTTAALEQAATTELEASGSPKPARPVA